jgi:hypothetical protein
VALVGAGVWVAALGVFDHAGGLPEARAAEPRWRPTASTEAWQYQLQGTIDTSVAAPVYIVDGADVPRATVRELHDAGRRVVCYFSAGTYERWRSDADRFPERALGKPVAGWPGERWLDVRRQALRPIMRDRMRRCRDKGFDAVDPDNVNGYRNPTGFDLKGADQLAYNRWVARTAHELGLAVGLKNDQSQARALEPHFDFAVLEQCFQYSECGKARRFVAAGKPVLDVEYSLSRDRFCDRARELGFAAMRKKRSLKAWRRPCA